MSDRNIEYKEELFEAAFNDFDANHDGVVSKEEMTEFAKKMFMS